jgi:hypothetical protein
MIDSKSEYRDGTLRVNKHTRFDSRIGEPMPSLKAASLVEDPNARVRWSIGGIITQAFLGFLGRLRGGSEVGVSYVPGHGMYGQPTADIKTVRLETPDWSDRKDIN